MNNQDKQLKKLESLYEMISNDTVTPKELEQFINLVLDVIKQSKEHFDSISKESLDRIDTELKNIQGWANGELSKKVTEVTAMIAKIPKDGKDGKDGTDAPPLETIVYEAVKAVEDVLTPLIPKIADIEEDLPKLGMGIRDGLELLEGDERLDKSAIKGLDEWLKTYEKSQSDKIYVGGLSGGGRIMKVYDLSDQLNGVLKTFTMSSFWRVISVQSSSRPNAFRPTTDYTTDASAMTITFTDEILASSTLAAGQTIIITYSE